MENPSNRRRPSLGGVLALYLVLALMVFALASFAGSSLRLTPSGVWNSYFDDGSGGDFGRWWDLRAVPLALAALVGGALALAGTAFQAVLRNPLAEPYILGVSGAGALGAMLARLLLPDGVVDSFGGVLVGAFAFFGAVGAVLLLLALVRWARLQDPPSLILAGAVLNAIFGALILLIYSVASAEKVVTMLLWVMGNVHPATASVAGLWAPAAALVVCTVVFLFVSRYLDLLSLGDEEAADLGVSPRAFRVFVLVVASLLTGIVVAAAGPIGFVGLAVPHILRLIHGPSHRRLIPLSVFGGAVFLMIAYTVSRTAIIGSPVPLGAVTALVGGPFFLFLLLRRQGVLS